jgi:hypothetical protein
VIAKESPLTDSFIQGMSPEELEGERFNYPHDIRLAIPGKESANLRDELEFANDTIGSLHEQADGLRAKNEELKNGIQEAIDKLQALL